MISRKGAEETLKVLRGRGVITPRNYEEGNYGYDASLDGLAGRLGYL